MTRKTWGILAVVMQIVVGCGGAPDFGPIGTSVDVLPAPDAAGERTDAGQPPPAVETDDAAPVVARDAGAPETSAPMPQPEPDAGIGAPAPDGASDAVAETPEAGADALAKPDGQPSEASAGGDVCPLPVPLTCHGTEFFVSDPHSAAEGYCRAYMPHCPSGWLCSDGTHTAVCP